MLNDNETASTPREGKAPSESKPDNFAGSPASASRRDLSRISLVISLLSLVLVAIFFFGLNRNLSGLAREVQDYNAMKNSVTSLDAYVDDILGQMGRINAQLLNIDERRRATVVKILMESMLDDMIQKTSFLSAQLGSAPEAAKLQQIQALLLELRHPAAAPAAVQPAPAGPDPVGQAEVKPSGDETRPESVQEPPQESAPVPSSEEASPEQGSGEPTPPSGGGEPTTMTQ
ncbi:hypothetical protein [Paucidesulfovibrio longus]|uniref:hypothetical protein n=1 Tax=Paucidesulfovibrio longus TaxID=889 RepID=UPI0003B69D4A|nr:hypothetical protein [Paucidesulfovibrio longus]